MNTQRYKTSAIVALAAIALISLVNVGAGSGTVKPPGPNGTCDATCEDPQTIVHGSNPPRHPQYPCTQVNNKAEDGTTNSPGNVQCGVCVYAGVAHQCGGNLTGKKASE